MAEITTPSSSWRFVKSPDVVARSIRGEQVLVPITSTSAALDSIFTLNPTASVIWERACAGLDAASIGRELAARYRVEEAKATADALRILQELVEIGALQPQP